MRGIVTSNRLIFRISRHLSLFISMILLFSWVAYSRSGNGYGFLQTVFMVTANAVFFFGYAYISIYLLIPLLLFKKKYIWFGLIFLSTGILLSYGKFLSSDYLFYGAISNEVYQGEFSFTFSDILVNTKDMTFIVAIFALLKFSRDNFMNRTISNNSEEKRLETEIKVLEHHLDPHVIFNNFNNLYSISINRPDLLSSTIKKLKSVLEYLFLEEKGEKVNLRKELQMIENYIGLERLRFGTRLKVTFDMEGNPEGAFIAPLLLYTFIENCFENGAGLDTKDAWIDIRIKYEHRKLVFRAANSLPDNLYSAQHTQYRGVLENSVKRLEMLYPNSHRLTIREKPHEHIVELQISLL